MATPLSVPGIYQDVQEVSLAGGDFIELDFSNLPAGHILNIQEVTGIIAVSTFAPTIKVAVEVIGGSDGGTLALIPSAESFLVPPAHGGTRNIALNNIVNFYTDARPIIRIFLESSAPAIALFTITGRLIKT